VLGERAIEEVQRAVAHNPDVATAPQTLLLHQGDPEFHPVINHVRESLMRRFATVAKFIVALLIPVAQVIQAAVTDDVITPNEWVKVLSRWSARSVCGPCPMPGP